MYRLYDNHFILKFAKILGVKDEDNFKNTFIDI